MLDTSQPASHPDPGAVADHAATAATPNKLQVRSATTGTGRAQIWSIDQPTDPYIYHSIPPHTN
jgi:hypothetical protein